MIMYVDRHPARRGRPADEPVPTDAAPDGRDTRVPATDRTHPARFHSTLAPESLASSEPAEPSLRDRIEAISPEGRPAHPRFGAGALAASLAVVAAIIIALAVLIGRAVSPAAGAAVAVCGLLLCIALNPVVWAAVARTRERRAAAAASRG